MMAVMTAVRRQGAHTGVMNMGNAAYDETEQVDEWVDEVPNAETMQAMKDVRLRRNLYGPFDTAAEAVASMLAD